MSAVLIISLIYITFFVVNALTLDVRYIGGSLIDAFIDTNKTMFILFILILPILIIAKLFN